MSRNIGGTRCYFCGGEVVHCGPNHPITPEEAGPYFKEYEGMIVADAVCRECLAKYIAWINGSGRINPQGWKDPNPSAYAEGQEHGDLSFRSTFDDEPGADDLPVYQVITRVVVERVGPYIREHSPYGRVR